jgi:hypothetical protein
MSGNQSNTSRSSHHPTKGFGRRVIYLATVMILLMPILLVQASNAQSESALPPGEDIISGIWRLVSSSQNDTWQGDNFHGLKSEYTPFYNGDAIGATYTQYTPQFEANVAPSISSQLTGSCAWQWEGGVVPLEVASGTQYPFTMAVDGNASGNGFLLATVNGYTQNGEGQGSIAYAQVYLDASTQVMTGHKEVSKVLTLSPGQKEGENRTVTLLCQIDIVTVQIEYFYQWEKTGCTATLKLPEDMKAGEEFSPLVTVVDSEQKPVTPKSEAWYYNGEASTSSRMKWDGKAASVENEYVCPNETQAKKVKINIPVAGACVATIILPDKMEPDKEFIPQAVVVDQGKKPVKPESETWYYNGVQSSSSMKWDGKATTVTYEYICPLDQQPGKVKITIPASEKSAGWLVVIGGAAAVAAAGLAAVVAGAVLVKGSGKKTPHCQNTSSRWIKNY